MNALWLCKTISCSSPELLEKKTLLDQFMHVCGPFIRLQLMYTFIKTPVCVLFPMWLMREEVTDEKRNAGKKGGGGG